MSTTSFLLVVALSLTSCSSGPQTGLAEDKYRISEITLERSGSWGLQSGYKVVIRKDGAAEYTGDIHSKRKGKYNGKISTEQFEQLARLVIENGYFSLEDKYHAPVTDTYTVTINILYSGGRKTVEDFGRGGGEGLTRIEQEIDKLVEQMTWTKDES